MAEPQTTAWDRQCLEALKSLGKTLGQMTLYKLGHPAVAATIKLAEDNLADALVQLPQGELSYSLDQDKLIANGRIIAGVNQLPNSVPGFFKRFKLNTLTFKSGLSNAELAAFCELAASRPDDKLSADPQAYLAERGVSHIVLNEAIYSKLAENASPTAPAAAAQPDRPAAPAVELKALDEALDKKSLDSIMQILVERAVPDSEQRGKVYDKVMSLLKEDIERRIDQVIKPLVEEKNILQNEQTRTQGVLTNIAEGVIMVDEHGKILMMNPAAEHIYGSSLGQVAGMHLAEKASEEHVVALAAEIATPKDRPIAPEVKVAGADDTRRTLKASGAVVQNEAGKVVGMVQSLTDVAKHKEFQRMQRDFVSHMTHELRAPLSSIRAALEILQGEVGPKVKDEDNKMLATAIKNSDRLADLINSILDFSKIESGQMTVFPKKDDGERIAREAVESLGPWAAKKRIMLSLGAEPQLPPVSADSQRTIQVLVNLISNALKFTPVGGQISVKLKTAGGGKEKFVQFSVTDTGCGIKKEDQKKIFEKFVQIASGDMHVGGTGLGLAIAKALVHLQGGKLWVESEEGKGATFLFTLPYYAAPRDQLSAAAPKPAFSARPKWWKRVLGLKK